MVRGHVADGRSRLVPFGYRAGYRSQWSGQDAGRVFLRRGVAGDRRAGLRFVMCPVTAKTKRRIDECTVVRGALRPHLPGPRGLALHSRGWLWCGGAESEKRRDFFGVHERADHLCRR